MPENLRSDKKQSRPSFRLLTACLVGCSIGFSLGFPRPAKATCNNVAEIETYCKSQPNFKSVAEPLRTNLVTKCIGVYRRRCGLDSRNDTLSGAVIQPLMTQGPHVGNAQRLSTSSALQDGDSRHGGFYRESSQNASNSSALPDGNSKGIDPVAVGTSSSADNAKQGTDGRSEGGLPALTRDLLSQDAPQPSVESVPPDGKGKGIDSITAGGLPSADNVKTKQVVEGRSEDVAPAPRLSGVPAPDEHRFSPAEVLVEFRSDVSSETTNDLVTRESLRLLGTQPISLTGMTMYRYHIEDRRSVAETVAALENNPQIMSVQPNYRYTLEGERQGALAEAQYVIPKMSLSPAHAISNGEKSRVAVIDSQIDRKHIEISNSVVESFEAEGAVGAPALHGTAVAGIIAAHAELTGVAPQARILAYQAFSGNDKSAAMQGTTYDILGGIEWSVRHGAQIINMSFAGPPDPALSREIASGARRGLIFIAAVGNEGKTGKPLYPAADENVIAVTATDKDDVVFKDANPCPTRCVAAPGVDILVAQPNGAYGFLSGTSIAAAHVSGVVALLLNVKPKLDLIAIRNLLFKTARYLTPSGQNQGFVVGIVDAYKSLEAISAPGVADLSDNGLIYTQDAKMGLPGSGAAGEN